LDIRDAIGTPFDQIILTEYLYPIAVGYRSVLEASDWPTKVSLVLKLFEYVLRMIVITSSSQYLIRNAEIVSDPTLNNRLLQ